MIATWLLWRHVFLICAFARRVCYLLNQRPLQWNTIRVKRGGGGTLSVCFAQDEDPVLAKYRIEGYVLQTKGDF